MRRLTDKQRAIVEENIPLVYWYMGRACCEKYIELLGKEEVESVLYLALCQAVLKYDPARGGELSSYVTGAFWRELAKALKLHYDSAILMDTLDTIPCRVEEDDDLADGNIAKVNSELGRLKPREAEMIENRLRGKSYLSISQRTGLKVRSVRTYLCSAMRQLRRSLGVSKAAA